MYFGLLSGTTCSALDFFYSSDYKFQEINPKPHDRSGVAGQAVPSWCRRS